MKFELEISVIGAGIGGLTLALALIRAGYRVRVFEQAPALCEVGAGLSLAPNAANALEKLGLGEELLSISSRPNEGIVVDGRTGEQLSRTAFGEAVKDAFGNYYHQVHRADLHQLLTNAVNSLDENAIVLRRKLTGFLQSDDGVVLEFEDGTLEWTDLVVACDGIKSVCRPNIAGVDEARFTGFVAWRAIIDMARLPSSYACDTSKVYIGPERNCTFYPIRDKTALNCVMFAGDSDWQSESWTQKASVNEIRAAFEGYNETIQTLIEAIDDTNCFRWALFDREPIEKWHDGRVVLLGDSAHPMLPFLGQGASMAIEDAITLSHLITTQENVEEAIAEYVSQRRQRTNWVLLESRRAGERFAHPSPSDAVFEGDKAMQTEKLFGWHVGGLDDANSL